MMDGRRTQHDDRGSIHRLKVGDRRINLLHSNEGVMRSGYLHNMEKSMFVVSGEVELWLLKDDDTEKLTLKEFDSVRIPPYVPHVLHFPAGKAVTAEWWQPKQNGEDLQCWFYHPYRRIVDVQNSMVSRSTGRHSLLVPQDMQKLHDQQSEKGRIHPFYGSVVSWTFGLVTGIVIGTLLSTSPPSSSRN
mmetsp:Transcript_12123/g.35149  ORF Transcript_12123/g.35149 Transcript_12123/m.35149 type:complete len:189 (+) Transcript_12123:528-1094(+)